MKHVVYYNMCFVIFTTYHLNLKFLPNSSNIKVGYFFDKAGIVVAQRGTVSCSK